MRFLSCQRAVFHDSMRNDVEKNLDSMFVKFRYHVLEIGRSAQGRVEAVGTDGGVLGPDIVEMVGIGPVMAGQPYACNSVFMPGNWVGKSKEKSFWF